MKGLINWLFITPYYTFTLLFWKIVSGVAYGVYLITDF